MIDFANKKIGPIGLDIGHNSIKMIQLAQANEKLRIFGVDEVPFDPELNNNDQLKTDFVISAIREMRSRVKFHGTEVITSLPNDLVKIKSLRFDATDNEQIEQLLRTEVADSFGLDPDTDQVQYMVAGEVYQGEETKNEVIVLAAENNTLEQYIVMLEEAGLTPVAIDAIPCALFRCFERSLRRQEDQNLASVLVDIGYCFTTVVIGRGQNIIFVKQIPLAGKHLNAEVASRMQVDLKDSMMLRSKLRKENADTINQSTRQDVINAMSRVIEDLAREISLCFKYYAVTFRGQKPREIVLAGGEASEDILLETLERQLGVATKTMQPFRGFDLSTANFKSGDGDNAHCEWAVATGLSMKGWGPPMNGA